MTLSRQEFADWLAHDEESCFPWEQAPAEERRRRRLATPATNLGAGRRRFWDLLTRVGPHLESGERICDFGAYPGTALRLIRRLPHGEAAPLFAAGFGFSREFRSALDGLRVPLLEMEFDVRRPPGDAHSHILTRAVEEPFDAAICTEVIEHQMHPLSLLVGMNRFLRVGGVLYLTTNSASFVGDVLKLAVGRHNVEALERSHVLADYDWRPHIRLYTLAEVASLLRMCGFELREGYYFDNANAYAGAKGVGLTAIRRAAGVVPHLRSHLWVTAVKARRPDDTATATLESSIRSYGLEDSLEVRLADGVT